MTVVIDTNSLLQALSRTNPARPLLDAWFTGRIVWAMSTEILFEYQEIITQRSGIARWQGVASMLDVASELRPLSVVNVSPAFRCHVITADPDDNKFVDCAFAANADFVITEDTHFRPLENTGYKSQPMAPAAFIARYLAP